MAVQDLVRILNEMTDLHDRMVEQSIEKKAAILQNDVGTLKSIILKETEFIKKMEVLEKYRISETGKNLTILETMKTDHLVEEKTILKDAKARLEKSVTALQRLNEINQQLLQDALFFVEHSLESLVGTPDDDDAIYRNPSTNGYSVNRTGFFDLKV